MACLGCCPFWTVPNVRFHPLAAKTVSADTAPADVVEKLLQAAQEEPLWDGVWDYGNKILGKPYPSQSEADFALLGAIVRRAHSVCVPENMVADAVIRVFEQSGLYRVEKRHRVLTQDIPNLITSHFIPAYGTHRGGRQAHLRLASIKLPPPSKTYLHLVNCSLLSRRMRNVKSSD
jgi:hypothetical protein